LPVDRNLFFRKLPAMNRPLCSLVSACMLLAATALPAAPRKPPHKSAHKAPTHEAKESATLPEEPLTERQLADADRVYRGRAECEFRQTVEVDGVQGKPGYFDVRFGRHTYRMVPEETTTGAVRLHDKQAGMMWLQIPVKSMLMDSKSGHRLVDACQHPQQMAAAEAVEKARAAAEAAAIAASAAGAAAQAAATAASAVAGDGLLGLAPSQSAATR
jgi:hypothetical protein